MAQLRQNRDRFIENLKTNLAYIIEKYASNFIANYNKQKNSSYIQINGESINKINLQQSLTYPIKIGITEVNVTIHKNYIIEVQYPMFFIDDDPDDNMMIMTIREKYFKFRTHTERLMINFLESIYSQVLSNYNYIENYFEMPLTKEIIKDYDLFPIQFTFTVGKFSGLQMTITNICHITILK